MNREEKRKQFQILKNMKPDRFWSAMNALHSRAYALAARHYQMAMKELLSPEQLAEVFIKANEIRISEGMIAIDTDQTEVELFYPEQVEGLQLGVPIPNMKTEMSARGASEVTVTKLSPEQMEKEFERMNGGSRAVPQEDTKSKEDESMNKRRGPAPKEGPACGLTRKDFLKSIAEGETISSIEKAWGMKYNTLQDWVKKWGYRGITPGKARELLSFEEITVPELGASEAPEAHVDPVVAEDVEQAETVAEKPAAEEPQVAAAEGVTDQPAGEAAVQPELGAVMKTEPEPIYLQERPQHQAFISVAVPLIISNETKLEKRDKAYEALSRLLSEGVDSSVIEFPVLAADILELLQVVVSLVYDQTSSVVVKPEKALEAVQEFFGHHNQEHIKRMKELLEQDGWSKVTV